MTQYGRYELIERIGQGALTEVFRAKRYGVEGFEKVLVVKRLHQQLARDTELVQSFIQRAQLALRLSHSNVVHVLDLGEVELETGKSFFLATELVSGATLAELLAMRRGQNQPLSLEMALHIAAEICRALDHAHRRRDSLGGALGIAHEKLSAENVLLSDEGEVKVSDFCTAALGAEPRPGPNGVVADLNQVGALVYEMLRLAEPPQIAPDSTFTGFDLPIDDLLYRLLLGDPEFDAAEAHEQLLMHAYACHDWVGAEQVAALVGEWQQVVPQKQGETYPPQLRAMPSSQPPPVVGQGKAAELSLGDFRPFVGRSAETTQVGRRLAIVAHRKLQAIGIVGAPGIGKSRFVHELRRRLRRGGVNLAFHVARCPVGGRQQLFSGIAAMLRTLFGAEGDGALDHEGLVAMLRTLGLSGPRANAILCELGASLPEESSVPPLRAAVERVFSSLADDRMHIFAWDDAEQMDDESTELLARVAEALASKRVAFLFAARELSSEQLRGIDGFEEVRLGPLDRAALKRLIQVRLGAGELPEDVEAEVVARSAGNPMFAEELLREAVASGAISVQNGVVDTLDLQLISLVPDTLQAQLENRLRGASETELDLLRLVARLDEWAKPERLAEAVGQSTEEVQSLLLGLQQRNLVIVDPTRARLPSRLIDEALRADLKTDQLAELELRAADALLTGVADDARLLEQAALHLEAAGEPARAAETYERAARARAHSARPERTVPLMLRALELIPLETRTPRSVADAAKLLADASLVRGEDGRLSDMVRRLSSHLLARSDMTEPELVDALLDLVRVQRATLHFHEAQQLLLRTQVLATGDPARLLRVLLQLADTQIALGDFLPAIDTLARFDTVTQEPSEAQRHEALVLCAHAHAQAGKLGEALGLLEQADLLSVEPDDARAFRTAQVRALSYALGGDWDKSAMAAASAATRARALGLLQQETAYRHYEGEALTHIGEYARAYAAFRSSVAMARDTGSERWVNRNRMMLAFLEGKDGSALAKRQVGECLALAERQHQSQDISKGRLLLGLLLRSEGDELGAQRELQLARQVAVAIGHGLLVSECDAALESG